MLGFTFLSNAQVTYTSKKDGSWSQRGNWTPSGNPTAIDNVIILSTNTMSLDAASAINNLTIEAGGILDAGDFQFTVNGALVVDGIYTSGTGAGDFIVSGTTIDGSGSVSINNAASHFIFNSGIDILPTADLHIIGNSEISANVQVLNSGSIAFSGVLDGLNTSTSIWTNQANSYVSINAALLATGVLNASSSNNTVEYLQLGPQSIKLPNTATYSNLTVSGSGIKTMSADLIVDGNLTISSGSLDANTANYTIEIKGDWTNNGDFVERTGQVTFSGTSDQIITNASGETFDKLILNKTAGNLTLNHDLVVSSALTLSAGEIIASPGIITLGTGTGAGEQGTLTAAPLGLIDGTFRRWLSTSTLGPIIFPVGTGSNARGLEITFSALDVGGTLSVIFVPAEPGNNGLPLVDGTKTIYNTFNEGYWSISMDNGFDLGTGTYDLELDGSSMNSFAVDDVTRLLSRLSSSNNWIASGTHVLGAASIVKRTGISIFPAQFAFGDGENCTGPVTSAISGTAEVCTGALGISYSVPPNDPLNDPLNTYAWTITGGSQASGGATNSITVNWDAIGTASGNVRVVESNTCTSGTPVDFPVSVNSIAPTSISGKTSVAENTSAVSYSVEGLAGYTYTWTVTGGTQATGGTTDIITVDWGTVGTGTVSVVAQKGCTPALPFQINVNIYIVIRSARNGDWNFAQTWDCKCIPLSTESVYIEVGHTVTVNVDAEINNIAIETGGVLSAPINELTVHGDLTVNGEYIGGTSLLTLNGVNTTIGGTGTINAGSGGMNISSGNKAIASYTNLTIGPGNLTIGSGTTLRNEGSIIVDDNIIGGDALSKWINGAGASLNIAGALMTTGLLDASETGNTITYNGAAQSIKGPASCYFNLSIENAGIKTLSSNLDVDGDLTITGVGTSLDANAVSNYSINLAGNWTNTDGTFTAQSGDVIFDGSTGQVLFSTGDTFYDFTVNNSSPTGLTVDDLPLGNIPLTVNGTLSIGSGKGFTAGTQGYTLLGEFVNNGTLTGTGSNFTFGGSVAQTISGFGANTFDSLTINNAVGVSLESDEIIVVSGALTINNGMKLVLPPTKQLTVSGIFTNSSDATGFVIESDATGTGSVIHSTANVAATVERYMDANSWHLVSAAVTGQAILDFATDVANNIPTHLADYGMGSYSESANNYVYYTDASSGNLVPGSSFLLRHTTDDAVSTYGNLSYASTDAGITRVGGGWNCVGNPFACPIGISFGASTTENFLDYNKDNLDPNYAILYFWDEPATPVSGVDYYKVISNAGFSSSRPVLDMDYLQPGQGFLVRSKIGGSTVSFTADMRAHDNSEVFVKKSKLNPWPGIILSIDTEGKSASTSITFNDRMTTGLDITYDAGLKGGDASFLIYSRLIEDNGVNFMLQCLPDFDFEHMVVPLGFDCSTPGLVSFSAEALNLPYGCGVLLEDRELGIITDLQDMSSSYELELDSDAKGVGRFFLHFTASSITSLSKEPINIYYYDQRITVKGETGLDARARLVDLSGRVIRIYDFEDNTINILPADNLTTGIYILHLYGTNLNESTRFLVE